MFYSDAKTSWLNLIHVWALFRWFLLLLGWILGNEIQGRMFKDAHCTGQIVLKSLICRLNVIDEVVMDVENRCNSNIQPAGWFRHNSEINVWIQWRRKWDFKTKELTDFTLFATKKKFSLKTVWLYSCHTWFPYYTEHKTRPPFHLILLKTSKPHHGFIPSQ